MSTGDPPLRRPQRNFDSFKMPPKQEPVKSTIVNRVFYIDVSLVPPKDIPMYMAKVKESLTPETNNKNNFVENAKSVGLWEDFFIPVKGVIPGYPNLWQRIKQFFVGREPQEISATRIELHQVEVTL